MEPTSPAALWLLSLLVLGALPSPGLVVEAPAEVVAMAVLDPGQAPLRAPRLDIAPDWRQRARLRVDLEVDTDTGPSRRTEYGPEVVVPLEVSVVAAPAREAGRWRLSVGRPEVRAAQDDPEPAWRLAEALSAVSGSQGFVVLSGRGLPVEARVPLRSGASPTVVAWVREALSSGWFVTPQFPEDPVGVGARWTVARAQAPGTLAFMAYELLELRGSRGRVRFQLQSQRGEGPPETRAEGELRFDLRRALPESLDVRFVERTSLEPEAGVVERLTVERRAHVTLEVEAPERVPVEAP